MNNTPKYVWPTLSKTYKLHSTRSTNNNLKGIWTIISSTIHAVRFVSSVAYIVPFWRTDFDAYLECNYTPILFLTISALLSVFHKNNLDEIVKNNLNIYVSDVHMLIMFWHCNILWHKNCTNIVNSNNYWEFNL